MRTVPAPNSYFLKIKCNNCNTISIVFSNSQTAVTCNDCNRPLCRPTGGKIRIADKCEFVVLGNTKRK